MTEDKVIRFATAVVVCAVAAFAAVVVAASLVLLHEARNNRDAPGLARFMLWLGTAATICTNVASLSWLNAAWPTSAPRVLAPDACPR